MAIRINSSEDPATGKTILSLQGSLTVDCAHLLEAECSKLLSDPTREICIELKELTYLDETGAATLARLKKWSDVMLEGSELFIQQMIDRAVEDT